MCLSKLSKLGPRAQGLGPSGADGGPDNGRAAGGAHWGPWAKAHGPGPWALAQSPLTDHADNHFSENESFF